jgi:hypothetical protein
VLRRLIVLKIKQSVPGATGIPSFAADLTLWESVWSPDLRQPPLSLGHVGVLSVQAWCPSVPVVVRVSISEKEQRQAGVAGDQTHVHASCQAVPHWAPNHPLGWSDENVYETWLYLQQPGPTLNSTHIHYPMFGSVSPCLPVNGVVDHHRDSGN